MDLFSGGALSVYLKNKIGFWAKRSATNLHGKEKKR